MRTRISFVSLVRLLDGVPAVGGLGPDSSAPRRPDPQGGEGGEAARRAEKSLAPC